MKFLEKLNLSLIEFEERIRGYNYRLPIKHPFYFVVGAPRAGTTLLTQLLAYYGMGYITNIAARFWCAPCTGIRLSKHILGDAKPTVYSDMARTKDPGDIHEYGKFWRCHFGWENSADVDKPISEPYYELTRRALVSISNWFDKPVVMKGIYPAYVHEMMDVMTDNQIEWVHITRDPLDCCVSIMNARRARGGEDKWFGWHPPLGLQNELEQASPVEQVAAQVAWFRGFYTSFATKTIALSDLCCDTLNSLAEIYQSPSVSSLPSPRLSLRVYPNEREIYREAYEKYEQDFSLSPT